MACMVFPSASKPPHLSSSASSSSHALPFGPRCEPLLLLRAFPGKRQVQKPMTVVWVGLHPKRECVAGQRGKRQRHMSRDDALLLHGSPEPEKAKQGTALVHFIVSRTLFLYVVFSLSTIHANPLTLPKHISFPSPPSHVLQLLQHQGRTMRRRTPFIRCHDQIHQPLRIRMCRNKRPLQDIKIHGLIFWQGLQEPQAKVDRHELVQR